MASHQFYLGLMFESARGFSISQLAFLKGQRIEWDSIKHTLLPKPDGTRRSIAVQALSF